MRSKQTRKDKSREEAETSVTGKDRMVENADLGDTGLSGSTTGDSEINYGMGEEGVRAAGNRLGGDSRAQTTRGGGSRESLGCGSSKSRKQKDERNDAGGGSRQGRSGG